MQITSIEIPYSSMIETFRLWFIGDVHLGSALCDETRLRADIEQIRLDKNARVFLVGDVADYIAANDWRFERDNIAQWVDDTDVGNSQFEYAAKMFDPIAEKIIGAIQGNHERTMEREFNNNVHKRLCDDLSITNLGYSALVRVKFIWRRGTKRKNAQGKNNGGDFRSIDIFLHHGFGGGKTAGADINRFAEMQRGYDADLYVMGHTHQRHASKSVQYHVNPMCDDLLVRVKLACRSGTYLKTVQRNTLSYSERGGMNPLTTGALCVTYHPHTRDLVANV